MKFTGNSISQKKSPDKDRVYGRGKRSNCMTKNTRPKASVRFVIFCFLFFDSIFLDGEIGFYRFFFLL